ncbi:major tail protein [Streptomyces phage Mischief19]|nr:major tail protein [Streptomyces phage Mischief19]
MSSQFLGGITRIRVTKVDACGLPVVGPNNAVVCECVATLAMNPDLDTADDLVYRDSTGKLCAVKKGCVSLLGYDVELTVLAYSPELVQLVTGNPAVLDAAGATIGSDDCSVSCTTGFAVEAWSELIGDACAANGTQKYLYTLMPFIRNGILNDITLGDGAINFQLNGHTVAGGQWGTGPWSDVQMSATNVPGKMLTPLGSTCHRRSYVTTTTPPTAVDCGTIAVPA